MVNARETNWTSRNQCKIAPRPFSIARRHSLVVNIDPALTRHTYACVTSLTPSPTGGADPFLHNMSRTQTHYITPNSAGGEQRRIFICRAIHKTK